MNPNQIIVREVQCDRSLRGYGQSRYARRKQPRCWRIALRWLRGNLVSPLCRSAKPLPFYSEGVDMLLVEDYLAR